MWPQDIVMGRPLFRSIFSFLDVRATTPQLLLVTPNTKKDLMIDKKWRGILCNIANVYQPPLLFYATQIINPFLNSIILANQDFLIPLIVSLL